MLGICKFCGSDLDELPPEANIVRHMDGTCIHSKPPVATQLGRIEQRLATIEEGLDKLLQSHAAMQMDIQALNLSLDENVNLLDGKLDGIRDGLASELAKLRTEFICAIGNAFVNFERKVARTKRRSKKS